MAKPKILMFSGSTRAGSLNQKLIEVTAAKLTEAGAEVTLLDLSNYPMPIYNGDAHGSEGVPDAAKELHALFAAHDGIFMASPEYNANVSPLLVNVIDWVSLVQENGGQAAAFGAPVFAIGSASPGGFGGYRGLMALRNMLTLQLAARVLPEVVSVSMALDAFDETGALIAPFPLQMLDATVAALMEATS